MVLTLASASGSTVVCFYGMLATGTLKNVLETDGYVRSVVYSPDGNTLASGGDFGDSFMGMQQPVPS